MVPHGCRARTRGWVPAWVQNGPIFPPPPGKEQCGAFAPSPASWLKPPPPPESTRRPRCPARAYWHNHRSQLAVLGAYAGLNLLLFSVAALQHAGLGGCVVVARGCGQCLNFNCAFLAVSAGSQEGCWARGGVGWGIPGLLTVTFTLGPSPRAGGSLEGANWSLWTSVVVGPGCRLYVITDK